VRTFVVGTSGQLARELRSAASPTTLSLVDPVPVDLADRAALEDVLNRAAPALVLNAGAYTAVDRAESEAERAFAVNARGPAHLASWCERNGACLIHVSTDYVFDGSKQSGYVEDDQPAPLNVYGASKLAGEQAVQSALSRHVILRTSWVYSAHGHNFVKTIARLARERSELRVVADQHGCPTSAAELAKAMLALGHRHAQGQALPWGTYHFTGQGQTTWHALAEAVVEETLEPGRARPSVVPITTAEYPTPARRPLSSVLDTSKFSRTFGLPLVPWRESLRAVARELSAPTGTS